MIQLLPSYKMWKSFLITKKTEFVCNLQHPIKIILISRYAIKIFSKTPNGQNWSQKTFPPFLTEIHAGVFGVCHAAEFIKKSKSSLFRLE